MDSVIDTVKVFSVKLFQKTEEVVRKKLIQLLKRVFPRTRHKLPDVRFASRRLKGLTKFIAIIIFVALTTIVFHKSETLASVSNEKFCQEKSTTLSSYAHKVEQACEKIAQKNPEHPIVWNNLGQVALVKQNSSKKDLLLSKAKKYFDKVDTNHHNAQKTEANLQNTFYRNFTQDLEGLAIHELSRCDNTKVRDRKVQQIHIRRTLKPYEGENNLQDNNLSQLRYYSTNRDKNGERAIEVFNQTPKRIEDYNKDILSRELGHFYCSKKPQSYIIQ